jgi:uncharacterized Fe-S center protein
MNLEEAINHCKEVAKSKCDSCGAEHEQLAEWLIELKWYRESDKRVYDKLQAEMFEYNKGFLISNYEAGYYDGIKKAIDILNKEHGIDETL